MDSALRETNSQFNVYFVVLIIEMCIFLCCVLRNFMVLTLTVLVHFPALSQSVQKI